MRIFKIKDKEYKIEFTFEAAEHKNVVQNMFDILSGAYMVKAKGKNAQSMMINGVSDMVADTPGICRDAFYAGLLEHNPVSEKEAKSLMKDYLRESKKSYSTLFSELKDIMEEDGFFDLSGLNEMLRTMQEKKENAAPEK